MKNLFILLTAILPFTAFAGDNDSLKPLNGCWKKQAKPLQKQYLQLQYTEARHILNHDQSPWKQTRYSSSGVTTITKGAISQQDTLPLKGHKVVSAAWLYDTALLYKENAYNAPAGLTSDKFDEYRLKMARYSPVPVLAWFQQTGLLEPVIEKETAGYSARMGAYHVTLSINKALQQVEKISYTEYNEFYGDVTTTLHYNKYQKLGEYVYPTLVIIEKLNGRIKDTVEINNAALLLVTNSFIDIPDGYNSKPAPKLAQGVYTEQYNDHIHLLYMPDLNDRVLVVEFDSFLLVAEAPLSSKNGELILAEARRLAPRKPVKYFVFGHHHPDYLGGMRAFAHKGATVLTTAGDTAYLRYLATAPHTLQPDSQQLNPKALRTQLIKDSLVIKDSRHEMRIYHIGAQSNHTNDYLVYYFPQEQMLFEDDLVWIPEGSTDLKKANDREKGLYNAIKALGIPVQEIVQSWSGSDNSDIKYRIPFSELEKKVQKD